MRRWDLNFLATTADFSIVSSRVERANPIAPAGVAPPPTHQELIRRIVHDFRAPVRQITAFADFLREDLGSALTPEAARNIDYIQEGAKRLGGLIAGYRELAMVNSQEMESAEIPLSIGLNRELNGVEVSIAEPAPPIFADPGLMRSVWRHALDSAVRLSRSTIAVQVSSDSEGDSVVAIDIRISDPGINAREAERAFLPIPALFGHAHDPGMALAVCHRAIDRMGGAFRAIQSSNGDLVLRIEIPTQEPPKRPGDAKSPGSLIVFP